MSDFDMLLTSTLSKTRENVHISKEKQERLYRINLDTKHTVCGKRIILVQCCVVLIIVLLFPVSILASTHAIKVMKEKVSGANLDADQVEDLYYQLKEEQGLSDEEIENVQPLCTNENGLTYGPDALGADLISVTSDQGLDGYVYREDLYYYEEYMEDFNTPEDAIKWQEEWREKYPNGYSIPVYENDGETQIGTFTIP